MSVNYDTSVPGKPYVRATSVLIKFPPPGLGSASVNIDQTKAVTLTTGAAVEFETVAPIIADLDLVNGLGTEFPLVDINTGEPLGMNATLGQTFLFVASYIRHLQNQQNK
jgi:hypothetical protein